MSENDSRAKGGHADARERRRIGSVAIERRVRSGALTVDDLPAALRDVQRGVIRRSPLALPVDQPYEPLLEHYLARFRR